MARFDVVDRQKPTSAPPTEGEAPTEGPPAATARAGRGDPIALFFRVFVLVVGIALLISGVSGITTSPAYGDFRPVSDMNASSVAVAPCCRSDYDIQVARDPSGEDLSVALDDGGGKVIVPTMADGEPRYGLKFAVIRVDPEMAPLVMVARPDQGARTVVPKADDGVRQDYEVVVFDRAGEYQLVFSADRPGEYRVEMSVAGAGTVGAFSHGDFDWLQIAAGVLLVALAVSTVYGLRGRRLHDAADAVDEAPDLVVHDGPSVLTTADGTYARIGPGRPSVTSDDEGPDTADRLAQVKGKGWVIRLD